MFNKSIDFPDLEGKDLRIGVVFARWNNELTYSIRDKAIEGLKDCQVLEEHIILQEVPGAYEVVMGAKQLIEKKHVDAVICIGVLIKGQTMHFEYISEAVTQGIMDLNMQSGIPVMYGILNCMTEEQARVRSVGEHNHGYGWGKAAVEMALLCKKG